MNGTITIRCWRNRSRGRAMENIEETNQGKAVENVEETIPGKAMEL
jgi:hypothetical protein